MSNCFYLLYMSTMNSGSPPSLSSCSSLLSTLPLRRGDTMPIEENEIYEFKMHTNFSFEELPNWIKEGNKKATRRPISRNINAFLNSGRGGMVFLGIDDDGVVKGINMSESQKEHFRVALEDVLSRYTPPVPPSFYQLSFLPVLVPGKKSTHTTNLMQSKFEPHLVRTNRPCWCSILHLKKEDRERIPLYVAQIVIKPVVKIKIVRQLYFNEENKCFIRRSASVHACSVSDIIRRTKEEVAEYFLKKESVSVSGIL